MGREYVPIFFDWLDTTQDLSDEERGRLINAVILYASGQEYEHMLQGAERIAFRFLKGQVDRNQAISDARAKAREKKEQPEPEAYKEEQPITNENKSEQNTTNFPKEEENKNKKENKNKNKEENKNEQSVREDRFSRFWAAYPRKEAKPAAKRAFDKLDPGEEQLGTMIAAIDHWRRSAQWQEDGGRYIPHPATWLNQRRWEDRPPDSGRVVLAQDFQQREYATEESMDDVLDRIIGNAG